jgi:hypothetical protein
MTTQPQPSPRRYRIAKNLGIALALVFAMGLVAQAFTPAPSPGTSHVFVPTTAVIEARDEAPAPTF